MANVQKWSKTASSNSTADSDINWAEGQAPSTVNNSARSVMQGIANWRDDTGGQLTLAGGTTAYTLTTNGVNTAYADGLRIHAVVNAANTGASTLNVDGLGAKNIYKTATSGIVAIGAGDLVVDMHAAFEYDASLNAAAGGWVLLNPIAAAGLADGDKGDITVSASGATWTIDANAVTTTKINNDAVTYAKLQNAAAGNVVLARAAATSGDFSEVALAASQLLGRGSTGDIAAILLGTGLSMSGTTLSSLATGIIDFQEFTTAGAGTWTKPAGATANDLVLVELIGGGAGGRAGNEGGGGGGYSICVCRANLLGSTVSVSVGSGGAGVSLGAAAAWGGNGGASTFSGTFQANGGTQQSGGAVPTGSLAILGLAGGQGGAATGGAGGASIFAGGGGGGGGGAGGTGGNSSLAGSGGAGAVGTSPAAGSPGTAPGGGGGGGGSFSGGNYGASGAGAAGRIRVWTFKVG